MQCGFTDLLIIPGLGFTFYLILSYICGILIHAVLKLATRRIKNKRFHSLTAFVGRLIYWNPLIRLFTENFLDFCLWCMLNILTVSDASPTFVDMRDVKLSTGISYTIALLLIVVPISVLIVYLRTQDKWSNE